MSVSKITTHYEDALKRLLYQYKNLELESCILAESGADLVTESNDDFVIKDTPRLHGLIKSLFGDQIQELEDALYPLFDRLDIDSQVGAQLDGIGAIVGQSRLGLQDDLYRIWIKAKIGQNVSEGDIERILSVWQLINSSATTIRIVEHFPAEVALYSDSPIDLSLEITTESGADLETEDEIDIVCTISAYMNYIWTFMQKIVSAGVKMAYAAVFDPSNAFGFYSAQNAGGFGDENDSNVGGELGFIELPI